VVDSLVYSLLRALVDLLVTGRADQAKLQAEVLVLRRQVQWSRGRLSAFSGNRLIGCFWRPCANAFRDRVGRVCW